MTDVNWLDERESRAWRGLQLMNMRLEAESARRLAADSDLSVADYVVLVALTDVDDAQLRQHELCDLLGWEKSRLSHHITRMEKRGLVEKRKCPTDLRGAFVVLTEHGRASIEAAAPGHLSAVRELFVDHLSPEQLDVIGDVAETVLAVLETSTSGDE